MTKRRNNRKCKKLDYFFKENKDFHRLITASYNYVLDHIETNFCKTAKSTNAHDWGSK